MDNIEALSPKPDEFVENKNSRHPKGLWVLFGTEMWERFNFYGMRALLTLFMVNSLLIKEADAAIIYGGFLALCYLTPLLGGFIADKYIGNRFAIILGGSLMAIGQFLLFISASTFSRILEVLNLSCGWLYLLSFLVMDFSNRTFPQWWEVFIQNRKNLNWILHSLFSIWGSTSEHSRSVYLSLRRRRKRCYNRSKRYFAFKWGFLAASIAMMVGTVTFFILKNKYVVTPEGRPIGGLPKNNTTADFEEGESQTAKFSGVSYCWYICCSVLCIQIFIGRRTWISTQWKWDK
jgi:POT family proton-dependent oligopeptide transporter